MHRRLQALALVSLSLASVLVVTMPAGGKSAPGGGAPADSLILPGEKHFATLRQLTFGGENAEAYFSPDGTMLSFQSTRDTFPCDQIFTMRVDGSDVRLRSTGKGRTTCAYYLPDNRTVLYASTHLGGPGCPPRPSFSKGYVWPVYPSYDIFTADPTGRITARLTSSEGYDAEATVSPDGKSIVFTSTRDGDLDLYSMDPDGGNVRRLTNAPGYDGGAFYSYDSKQICFRSYHPEGDSATARYRELLAEGLVSPANLELWVMDADGSNARRITRNGAANFCPFFHPDGKRLIFASNLGDPGGRNFDLYLVNLDGTGLEKVAASPEFDGFPMFSPDGTKLVFASNRGGKARGETNLFVADWRE